MNLLFITKKNPYGLRSYGGAESSIRLIAEHAAIRGHRIIYLTRQVTSKERNKAKDQNVQLFSTINLRATRFGMIQKFQYFLRKIQLIVLCFLYRISHIYCYYDPETVELALWAQKIRRNRPKIIMRMAGLFWYEHILKAPEWKARYETLFNSVDAVNFLHPALADLVYEKMQELEMSVKFKGNFCGDIGSCLPVGRSLRYECLSEHPFQIVMVARFTDIQKRQDILVQGVAKIPKNIQIHLTLIGNGIRKPFIKELVNKLGIEDCVSFFDFMPQEKLWSILMRSSLLCNCSDFEGVSKIVLESMAIGLPVLCSDVLPNNSYITEGYNGFLVENNPEAWAEKLCLLVDDRSVRQRVSSEAMRYISRKYDPYRNITLYEHAFKSI